jgi:hypothetical protein
LELDVFCAPAGEASAQSINNSTAAVDDRRDRSIGTTTPDM